MTRDPEEEETKVWDHSRARAGSASRALLYLREVKHLGNTNGDPQAASCPPPSASALQGASEHLRTRQALSSAGESGSSVQQAAW